jgi:hypothetical protein
MTASKQLPAVGVALVDIDFTEIQINFEHAPVMEAHTRTIV